MLPDNGIASAAAFQSTQPKRAATLKLVTSIITLQFQSTQPKRAATDIASLLASVEKISIHAAQEGCDINRLASILYQDISIHAAQEGCDREVKEIGPLPEDFNPRSPRGLRQQAAKGGNAGNQFQSTQPKRAATKSAENPCRK